MNEETTGCDCIFCRRREFGDSFALYLYSEILSGVSICTNLIKQHVSEDSLENDTLGGYLSSVRCDTDELISIVESNDKYINYLKEHKLFETLEEVVDQYWKLWEDK